MVSVSHVAQAAALVNRVKRRRLTALLFERGIYNSNDLTGREGVVKTHSPFLEPDVCLRRIRMTAKRRVAAARRLNGDRPLRPMHCQIGSYFGCGKLPSTNARVCARSVFAYAAVVCTDA
ncbi:hypothetical protein SAMN05443245_6879 [Paraburkholderia fungorum]|uniref:Uncharacterized protein n=1 Tax=Paraburkholderia fungorum TaxID=134537 RepID=A0A1H1JMW5_9BURK|nr:hypothetical protein SAMN05443245_6879 [Paraburkholderia fungorum]